MPSAERPRPQAKRATAALITLAAMLAGAAPAAAETFCVPAASAACAGTDAPTITAALAAANGNGAGTRDTIRIAAQTTPYTENNLVDAVGNPVDIIGAGPTRTVIAPAAAGNNITTLSVEERTSTVSNLGLVLATGPGPSLGSGETGLLLGGSAMGGATATGIAVTEGGGATTSTGVALSAGARIMRATISLPSPAGTTTTGVAGPFGGQGVEDSVITATTGVAGSNVIRSRLLATVGVESSAIGFPQIVEDTTIRSPAGATNATGIDISSGILGQATAVVRHVTLIGNGDPSGVAARSVAGASSFGSVTSVTIGSSILRGWGRDLVRTADAGGGHPATASIAIEHSDYDPARVTDTNFNGGAGSITAANDVNVDPAFVTTTTTDPRAYHLLASSPVIDAGNPLLAAGESVTDADGAPRKVAGRTTGTPIPDMGAFEFQPHPPLARATTSGGARVRQLVTFDASGSSDPDPGDVLTYAWRFDDGATALGRTVTHAFGSGGSHFGTLTVTDLSHRSASATAGVQVTSTVPSSVLSVSKRADHGRIHPGRRDGFTITLSNRGGTAITARTISDRLPAGWRYVPGSSTLGGRAITDPRGRRGTVVWRGPVHRVTVRPIRTCHGHGRRRHCRVRVTRRRGAAVTLRLAAHRSLRLHLFAVAPRRAARYVNRASAQAPAARVLTSAARATVIVSAGRRHH